MKVLLQIYLRTAGVALASQHFLTFVKIGVGVCKLFFLHQKTNLASKKSFKNFLCSYHTFLAWRFGVYFILRFSSNENKCLSMQRGEINP